MDMDCVVPVVAEPVLADVAVAVDCDYCIHTQSINCNVKKRVFEMK
jgi:hypothetical protein